MNQHQNFKFSVTVHTDDQSLVGNLSALAHISEPENPRQIYIEGQAGGNWEKNGHQATFHFSNAENRHDFIEIAGKLYADTWKIKDQRDNDPPYDPN
jgi:hypothetical protein